LREYFKWKNFKKSPEAKGAKLIVKGCFLFTVYSYLLMAGGRTYLWGQIEWARMTPVTQIDAVYERAIRSDNFAHALQWTVFQSVGDTKAVIEGIERHAAELPAAFFFEMSRRVKNTAAPDQAAFWSIYARFRLRYDLLRCSAADSVDRMEKMMAGQYDPDSDTLLDDKKKLAKMIRDVISYDAKYPAKNSPVFTCSAFSGEAKVLPRGAWGQIRLLLVMTTNQSIPSPDAK